jgi:hypothetical protein
VELHRGNDVYICVCVYIYIYIYIHTYIECVFELLFFMGTWVLYKCAVLVLMVAHVFLGFSINVDIMRIYVVGAADLVPSCFW